LVFLFLRAFWCEFVEKFLFLKAIDFKKKTYRGLLVRGSILRSSFSESKGFARHDLSRLTVGCTFHFLKSYI